jgi:hypothetical protein
VALDRPDVFRLALIESPNLLLGNGQLLRDTISIARAPDRIAIGIGSTEVNFPNIEQHLGPLGLNERDTDPGYVRMVETLASNLKGPTSSIQKSRLWFNRAQTIALNSGHSDSLLQFNFCTKSGACE